jgi:hypothetical protein
LNWRTATDGSRRGGIGTSEKRLTRQKADPPRLYVAAIAY